MQPCDMLVRGRIVTPDGVAPGEVRVLNGIIQSVDLDQSSPEPAGTAAVLLETGESLVLPGAVDAHVHCLSSPAEGVEAATRSALAGGVTTVVEMPYDSGNPVTDINRLAAKRTIVEDEAHSDVALLATVQPVGGAEAVGALVRAGACGFKLSLFDTDSRRFPRVPDLELLDVFDAIAEAGSLACVHAENDEIIKPLIERFRASGRTAPPDHCLSRPPVSETEAVLKALEFSRYAGCRIHFCHLSLQRSLNLVSWYAADGLDATTETCPHYLTFTAADMAVAGTRLKINPPLRAPCEREALWQGIACGSIDVVGSDHAPWPLASKTHVNVFDNHSGVPGVETLVPLVLGQGFVRGIAVSALVQVLCTKPAQRFGLNTKGVIAPGYDADLVVFDPEASTTIDETQLRSNAGWSPYNGMQLPGRITHVVSRGDLVFDGELHSEPGRGHVLTAGAS